MTCPICGHPLLSASNGSQCQHGLSDFVSEIKRLQPFEEQCKEILKYLKSGITFTWRNDIKKILGVKPK